MITLRLTDRELATLTAVLEAMKQLLGDAPEWDLLDRLSEKLDRALTEEPVK